MSYVVDNYDNAIVISGWEKGIADDPYNGISNLQNVNVVTVPGECSVSFATTNASPAVALTGGTITSVAGNRVTFSATIPTIENGMAVTFQGVGSYTGLTVGSCYWLASISNGSTTALVYSDVAISTQVSVGGTGNAPFTFFNMSQPKYFVAGSKLINASLNYFMVDSNGNVWSNKYTTTPSGFWVFMGNSVKNAGTTSTGNEITGSGSDGHNASDQSEGNGIFYFSGSSGSGYLFVLSSSSIDYMTDTTANKWSHGWNPTAGSIGSSASQFTMGAGETTNISHQAILAPDGRIYFCDWYNIRKLFQTSSTAFNPLDNTTYTYTNFTLLPYGDFAQCLAPLGTKMLIGGQKNAIYVWDTTSNLISYPILLPENNVANIVTVDSNAYIFTGNRGRIYITSGAQAQLFKKVPDHISTTIEPYYTWGGATYNKNQLYFGFFAVTNAKNTNANYGGLWAVNLENNAIRLVNQHSYGNYDGFASAIISNSSVDPGGAGLFVGWVSQVINNVIQSSFAGIDTTTSNPYTNSQSIVESDFIPIGTFDKPRDFTRIEYKLSTAMTSGESITLQYRTDFTSAYTTIFTDTATTSYLPLSKSSPVNFKNAQWIQIKAILNSTSANPSYVRLKQIRLTGLVGPTLGSAQQLSNG